MSKKQIPNSNVGKFKKGDPRLKELAKLSRAFYVAKKLTHEELQDVCTLIIKCTRTDLAAIMADPETPILKVNLIAAILSDINQGKMDTVDKLMDRIVGKPKSQAQDVQAPSQAVQVVINLPDNGRGAQDIEVQHKVVSEDE